MYGTDRTDYRKDAVAETREQTTSKYGQRAPRGILPYLGAGRYLLTACNLLLILICITNACQLFMIVALNKEFSWISSALPTMIVAMLLLIMLKMAIPSFMKVSVRRQLEYMDWQICLECGYALKGLNDTGRCPECATPFNIQETCEHWKSWMQSPRRWTGTYLREKTIGKQ